MITYRKIDNTFSEIPDWKPGCWIEVTQPEPHDIEYLIKHFQVPDGLINDISDIDERPRTEIEDDWQLIILRIPYHTDDRKLPYITIPMGILIRQDVLITLSFFKTQLLDDFITHKRRKNIQIQDFFEFFLRFHITSSVWYLKFLKQINRQISDAETELEESIKNEDLQNLLRIEKSLVFFVTSLKANGTLLTKVRLSRLGKQVAPNEEIRELIEDAEIETQQAIDLANIYSDILSGMMDAFASVISNNLNVIMKRLTTISIILMVPTLIASLYGMNVPNFLERSPFAFGGIVVGCALLSFLSGLFFKKKNWF